MAQDYEYLPDDKETYTCDCWWHTPSIIDSPPTIHFNPFYFDCCCLAYSNLVIRFPVPPPDMLDRLGGKK